MVIDKMDYSFLTGLTGEDKQFMINSMDIPEILHELKKSNDELLIKRLRNLAGFMDYNNTFILFNEEYQSFLLERKSILEDVNSSDSDKHFNLRSLINETYRHLSEMNIYLKAKQWLG